MTTEHMSLSARRPQWLLAALSFVVVACLGGAGSLWVVMHLQHQAGQAASAQTQAFASSVARTLAGQFEHAVNHGAPLKQIPRVDVYLAKIQRSTPGVSQITLKDEQGNTLAAAQNSAVEGNAVASVAIERAGQTVGSVSVQVATSAVGQQQTAVLWLLPAAVLAFAALTAGVVGWGLARSTMRAQALLTARLPQSTVLTPLADSDFVERPLDDPWQATLHCLLEGDAHLQDKLTTFENLAQEMLAVDFDGQLAPRIAAIRSQALRSLQQEAH